MSSYGCNARMYFDPDDLSIIDSRNCQKKTNKVFSKFLLTIWRRELLLNNENFSKKKFLDNFNSYLI